MPWEKTVQGFKCQVKEFRMQSASNHNRNFRSKRKRNLTRLKQNPKKLNLTPMCRLKL